MGYVIAAYVAVGVVLIGYGLHLRARRAALWSELEQPVVREP